MYSMPRLSVTRISSYTIRLRLKPVICMKSENCNSQKVCGPTIQGNGISHKFLVVQHVADGTEC